MPSRCVLILLDGLGDRWFPELGGTPLQAAFTPNLDALAAQGANGLLHAHLLGTALSSQDAHFSMFGYDLDKVPVRSVLEALGSGIVVKPEDVMVLGRLVSAKAQNGKLYVLDRHPSADSLEFETLFREVAEFATRRIKIEYKQTSREMGVLTLKGTVSPCITDTDPQSDGAPIPELRPWRTSESDPVAQQTAGALKEYLIWTFTRLNGHWINRARISRGAQPINAVLTHLAGRLTTLEPFREKWGLRGLSISSKLVQWGVSAATGMDSIRIPERDDPAEEISEKLAVASEKLSEYEFIHVHTMAPDRAAHTKVPAFKKETIESLDRGIGKAIGPLLQNPEVLIAVGSDHTTPSSGPLIHSGEPVPLCFVGAGVRRDHVTRFNEVDCAGGSLGMVQGRQFMNLVLSHLDRARLYGLMYTPDVRAYTQKEYEPFRLDGANQQVNLRRS